MLGRGRHIGERTGAEYLRARDPSLKGRIGSHVLRQRLAEHLPPPPALVLDVDGGAGHQAIPRVRAGYQVTILDPAPTMLAEVTSRLEREDTGTRAHCQLVEGRGEDLPGATGAARADVVLCHGVLMCFDEPGPLLRGVANSLAPGCLLSLLALQAHALVVQPAPEGEWSDALAAFDAAGEVGVLGLPTRADTPEGLSEELSGLDVDTIAWHGVWLFADRLGDRALRQDDEAAMLAVEPEAGRRDP